MSAVYFTNAIKTRTHGVDLRLDYSHELKQGATLKFRSGYQYSKTRIQSINPPSAVLGNNAENVVLDSFSRVLVEQGQPAHRFNLRSTYSTRSYDLMFNLNRFGAYASTWVITKLVLLPSGRWMRNWHITLVSH